MLRAPTIRVRLTLVFTVVMAAVLAATGFFVHGRLRSELDGALNQGLRSRADDVAALVRQADTGLAESRGFRLASRNVSFAQVIDSKGGILDATPGLSRRRVIDARELGLARLRTTFFQNRKGSGPPVRLLATPVRAQDQQVVIVVGSSLGERDRALARLRSLMLIGGPVALVLAALAGYGLAAAALRPVDAMRRRAAELSASTPGGRLPVPHNSDELARLGTTLNGLLARLEEALARERRFVADASHELMTPLALLQTELELASGRPPEELPGVVRSAGDETKALTRLARDLLVLARSDSGQLPVERASIDVEALFRRVASRSVAADAGTPSIDIDVPEGMVIEADQHRLEQALGNLVDNALRHGGGDVNLSARAEDGTVELHVTDEGPGIPEAFLGQAFERFSRADGAHRQGAGLGLAIAMTIAEAHGGTANAANRPGGGTDVWLSLPVRWSQPVAAHHVADRGEVGRPAAS